MFFINTYGQSKKEQIEILNNRVDSLKIVLDKIYSINDTLTYSLSDVNKRIVFMESEIRDRNNQLKTCLDKSSILEITNNIQKEHIKFTEIKIDSLLSVIYQKDSTSLIFSQSNKPLAQKLNTFGTLNIIPYKEQPLYQNGVLFFQNDKVIFYYDYSPLGKIKINDKEYTLNKITNEVSDGKDNSYEIYGDEVKIKVYNCKFDETQASDCSRGVYETVVITLNGVSKTFRNIFIQNCSMYPHFDY
jgi:hypothetical protein